MSRGYSRCWWSESHLGERRRAKAWEQQRQRLQYTVLLSHVFATRGVSFIMVNNVTMFSWHSMGWRVHLEAIVFQRRRGSVLILPSSLASKMSQNWRPPAYSSLSREELQDEVQRWFSDGETLGDEVQSYLSRKCSQAWLTCGWSQKCSWQCAVAKTLSLEIRCSWAMAVFLRHNTHTGPNYRVPLLKETHGPECQGLLHLWRPGCSTITIQYVSN